MSWRGKLKYTNELRFNVIWRHAGSCPHPQKGWSFVGPDFSRLEQESYATGKSLDELVEKSGVVDNVSLIKAKAKLYNVPFVSLTELASSPEALAKLPESVAEHYQALPFEFETKTKMLSVAMANPLDLQSIAFLEAKSGTKVKPFMAIAQELNEEIPRRYSQGLSAEVSQVLKNGGL